MNQLHPRKPETEAAYQACKQHSADFDLAQETVVCAFEHWLIIENRFPYDTMVRTNHMLVSKRSLASYYDASQDEQEEYHKILKQLACDGFYDAYIENFPKTKSINKHVHIHLIQWHNTQGAS